MIYWRNTATASILTYFDRHALKSPQLEETLGRFFTQNL
jgi:hypothetical protein